MPVATFTEFLISQAAGANALNAGGPRWGATDGPILTDGVGGLDNITCTSVDGTDFVLENADDGEGWGSTAVDDFVRYDTAGAKEFCRVKTLAYGSDNDKILVTKIGTLTEQKVTGKGARVGGAWALPSAAAALLNALVTAGVSAAVNAAGNPPRLSPKRHGGNPYIDYGIPLTTAHSAARPLTFEGCDDNPGDIDPYTSNNRTIINTTGNGSGPIILSEGAYVRLLNVGGTAGGTTGRNALSISTTDNFVVRNVCFTSSYGTGTVGHGCRLNGSVTDLVMHRAIFENCTGCGIYSESNFGANNKLTCVVSRKNASHGIMGFGTSMVLEDSLIYGNGGCGVVHLSNANLKGVIRGNTIADNASHGIDFGTMDLQTVEVYNNIIADNGGADINSDLTTLGVMFGLFGYNCLHGNASTIADDAYVCIPANSHNITTEPWTELIQATRKATGVYTTTAAMKGVGAGTMPDSAIANPTSRVDLGYYQVGPWGGTYPAANKVDSGEADFGPTGTEYDPALDLTTYTLKSGVAVAGNVRKDVERYSAGPLGTCYVPNWTYVLTGTNVDNTTGTLTLPAVEKVDTTNGNYGVGGSGSTPMLNMALYTAITGVAVQTDVRFGVSCYGGGPTGLAYIPTAANVIEGVDVDATEGSYHEAETTEVKDGVMFGPSSTYEGSYEGGGGGGATLSRVRLGM